MNWEFVIKADSQDHLRSARWESIGEVQHFVFVQAPQVSLKLAQVWEPLVQR